MEHRKRQPARRFDPLRQYHLGNADNRRDVHLQSKGGERRRQRYEGAEHRHSGGARGARTTARHHQPHHGPEDYRGRGRHGDAARDGQGCAIVPVVCGQGQRQRLHENLRRDGRKLYHLGGHAGKRRIPVLLRCDECLRRDAQPHLYAERAGIRGSSPYGRQLADGLVVRARPAELCGACGLRDAVAPETGKLNPETPEGRRLKPPFFLGSPLKQPGVGEFIGRGRGRYREWLQCHSRRMFCFGACLFRWAYRCS